MPSTADIESLPGFRYELRMYEVKTEFEKSGLLGFKYRENAEGDKVVYKIARMTPAASLENGCEGMVLVRVRAGAAREQSVAGLSMDALLKLLSKRPIQMTFEHTWQKVEDGESRGSYFYNSKTEESQWDRPPELGPVVDAMREWYGAADSPSSPQPVERGPPLDDSAEGFKYEVATEFTAAGRLGFEFEEDDDGRVLVQSVNGGSEAAQRPHVCSGMLLSRLRCAGHSTELRAAELGFDRVMDMMQDRPLYLVFDHPWQRVSEGSADPYFFNSWTDESRWDRPPELEAVLESMRDWKGSAPQQPPIRSAAAAGAEAARKREPKREPKQQPPKREPKRVAKAVVAAEPEPPPPVQLNEDADDFRYLVHMRFDEKGSLGLRLAEDEDMRTVLQGVHPGTAAARELLACEGLLLMRIEAGAAGGSTFVGDGSVPFDRVMDMLAARPLTLTFEHPWQRASEGSSKPYFFNSLTEESVWKRPPELEEVLQAMKLWAGAMDGDGTGPSMAMVDSNVATGQRLLFEDKANGGAMVEVTLVTVDRAVLPPEQEEERGYTVRLPDGRERNTLRSRLRLLEATAATEDSSAVGLPAVGAAIEVYSVSEGKWFAGQVVAHTGKTESVPGSVRAP